MDGTYGLMLCGKLAPFFPNYDHTKCLNYVALFSIIQDSEEDWAEEAACMDKVYRGGICNFAACDTSDSNGSLFSSRQPQVGAPIVHRQTYTD